MSADSPFPKFQHTWTLEREREPMGLSSLVQGLGLWEQILALYYIVLETEYKRLMFLLFYCQEERKKNNLQIKWIKIKK